MSDLLRRFKFGGKKEKEEMPPKDVANSALTTADNSILEKASPAPEEARAEARSIEQSTVNNEDTATASPSEQTGEDDTVYPGLMTKIGVGIGLALAVFLVHLYNIMTDA
jgi:hypothetical protein